MSSIPAVQYLMFSIRDVKTDQFHTPYFNMTRAGAIRAFHDLVMDPQSTINRHPADFALYEIGAFDSNSAELTPSNPQHLANATEFSIK